MLYKTVNFKLKNLRHKHEQPELSDFLHAVIGPESSHTKDLLYHTTINLAIDFS